MKSGQTGNIGRRSACNMDTDAKPIPGFGLAIDKVIIPRLDYDKTILLKKILSTGLNLN
jgi:hypothetical protein